MNEQIHVITTPPSGRKYKTQQNAKIQNQVIHNFSVNNVETLKPLQGLGGIIMLPT